MEITWENFHVNIEASRVKTFLGIMLSSLFYLFWPTNVNFFS